MPRNGQNRYARLAGGWFSGRDAAGRQNSLWLGADHVLCVEDGMYIQTVSRIDLQDIEALTLCPTGTHTWVNILSAVPCVIGLVLVLAGSFEWAIFGAILLAPCLLVLIANLLLGPSCECRIQTRVQSKTLRAVNRFRYARRVLPAFREAILAAQADLPGVREQLLRGHAGTPSRDVPPAMPSPEVFSARHPAHALLFGLMAFHTMLVVALVRFLSVPMLIACMVSGVLLTGVAVVTAGIQHRRPVVNRLRVLTWVSVAAIMTGWAGSYAFFWFSAIKRNLIKPGFSAQNQVDQLAIRFARDLVSEGLSAGLHTALTIAALIMGLLAMAGFALFLTAPPRVARAAATPPGGAPEQASGGD